MPTGYTAPVQSGEITSLQDYALTCARAFGALITMREAPADAPIPEAFVPETSYHDECLAKAQVILAEMRSLTPEQAEYRALKAWEEATAEHIAYEQKQAIQRGRYEAMLAQVEAWTAPTAEHTDLAKFMADQLRQSIDFDCGYEREPPARVMGEAWRAEQIRQAERSIKYHTDERAKEVKRAEERTRWVAALRASLPVS